ncbi:uncharacterized protein [Gossypium hirsutum]|uniref:Reverse transcriptase domain-containing protein n=1 Tax=Gossypium hirsutum TaxID=3635 RepID=A0A1U8JK02_GOSHI|nr:uncharacterized protein LOC107907810 [Gossypium hirsutum]
MMKHLGFYMDWITLIMRCVCSVSYSVCLNGFHGEWFSPSRGLRQGDPLSPYLFLICAKGFSALISDARNEGRLVGATIGRERFAVNHLFFPDDCILFGDVSSEGAGVVREIIREYEKASGQRVNFEKSLIYFGANVQTEVKEDIVNQQGVRLASNPEKYLGLPMMVGKNKKWAFANYVDRFRKRVEGWSLRYLSMGGKEDIWNALMVQVPHFESSLDHKERFVRAFLEADDRHKKIIAISLWSLWPVTGSAGKEIWRPLDDGFIKINFNASFVQDKGLAITRLELVRGRWYLRIRWASSDWWWKGMHCLLEKNISNGEASKSIIRPIIYHIQQLARIFEEITYTFVPREGNEAAHVLAIEGRRKGDCQNWATDVPDLVLTTVRKDWIAWLQI